MYAEFSRIVQADGWFTVVNRSKDGCGELSPGVMGKELALEMRIGADGFPANASLAKASDKLVLAPTQARRHSCGQNSTPSCWIFFSTLAAERKIAR